MAKPALGRGLSALLSGVPLSGKPALAAVEPPVPQALPTDSRERVELVSLERIRACPFQPRKDFPPDSLRELADSIRERGIVQPLIVRDRGGYFELIAGERRWRAAQLAGLSGVPVIVREADDRAALELALIENLQRENLNPIEEALGYNQLIEQFELTQEEAAAKVGKSRAVVANALRLLKLAPPLQSHIREGRLSVGHAKVILGLAGDKPQQLAAQRVIKEGLNVRQTEVLVARLTARATAPAHPGQASAAGPDAHISDLENRLRERLGTRIHLRYAQGKGSLEISFFNDQELERILHLMGVSLD